MPSSERITLAEEIVNRDAEPPHGDFYVTIRRGRRVGYLLGPYGDVRDALANVDRGHSLAVDADPFAAFDAFGTARVPIGSRRPLASVFGL